MTSKNFCKDCGQARTSHVGTWIGELTDLIAPSLRLPRNVEVFFDRIIERSLIATRLAELRDDFTRADVQPRSWLFAEEMRRMGAVVHSLKTISGFTNHFRMKVGDKIFRFEILPIAEFASKYPIRIVDDKELAKRHLKKGGFPVAEGRSFWFWQNGSAVRYGQQIGFPLVVKPRNGSVSRHVTTDIRSEADLEMAIRHATRYSPLFIVEKFVPNAPIHRATVIDFDFVVCVRQAPANVVGDGVSTIRELIDAKDSDLSRGESHQRQFTLCKIVENETTESLFAQKGYHYGTIPQKGEIIYLQKDPFLKLGGDIIEETPIVHKDNLKLFGDIARFFDTRITGIDFLAGDITVSWKDQPCAVLELNSTPCIDLHHFPSSGTPTDPAKALADMFFKYYL